jgi:RND family efflux transporter MFP subunit
VKVLLLVVSLLALLAVGFWVQKPPAGDGNPSVSAKDSPSLPEVQVAKPIRRDIAATLRVPATVSPYHQTTLYAKVSGFLKVIHVDKGDRVQQGQVLAVIEAPEINQQYEQALADYTIRKVTYERLAQVWKEAPDVIAKQEVDVAQAAADASRHLLEQRQTWLDYTQVRAPYGGTVTARFVDPGALIQAAMSSATQAVPLFTIMDVSRLRLYVNVPQEDALFVRKGTPATISIKIKDSGVKALEAVVTRSTQALDPGTRTMLVEIDVANPGQALMPGMFVEVALALRQHPNTLVIPPAALVSDNSSKAVFVIEQSVARKVPIKTGIDDGIWVEVTEGLTGSEDVVVVGKSRLADGKPVKASPYNLPAGQPSSQKY